MLSLRCFHDIISQKKTEPATEQSPPGKIVIPMKKLCITKIIPSAPQNISNPSRNNLTPPPIISTSLKNSTATFRNILTTQACNNLNQTTQTKSQPLSEKIANPS